MRLNFQTSLEGIDAEGRVWAHENRGALLAICEMLAPQFLGIIKTECRRSGIVPPDEFSVTEEDGKVG